MRLRPGGPIFGASRAGRPLAFTRRDETDSTGEPALVSPGGARAVVAAGVAVAAAALVHLVAGDSGASSFVGIGALLVAAALAERLPLPLESVGERGVTLTPVFGLAAIGLFGWAAGTVVFFGSTLLAGTLDPAFAGAALRRAAGAALAAASAGAAAGLVAGAGADDVAFTVAASAAVLTATGAALARLGAGFADRPQPIGTATLVPLVFMASTAVALVVLWQRSPVYSLALAGPLAALLLYGRSTRAAIGAMRLALTDPLTGLGNRRHFQERLQRELALAEKRLTPLSLCLLDVDDFKRVNDQAGHVAGDEVLVEVASKLRSGGEAFRLGGDEFALLLPGVDAAGAVAAGEAVRRRIRSVRAAGDRVTASIGVSTFPPVAAVDVVREADAALYRSKELGKDRVSAHGGDLPELAGRRRAALLGRTGRRRGLPAAAAGERRDP